MNRESYFLNFLFFFTEAVLEHERFQSQMVSGNIHQLQKQKILSNTTLINRLTAENYFIYYPTGLFQS